MDWSPNPIEICGKFFIDFKRGRVWYAGDSKGPLKCLFASNVLWLCLRPSEMHSSTQIPSENLWSMRQPPGWRERATVLLQAPSDPGHSKCSVVVRGFWNRSSSFSLLWFLVLGLSKGHFSLSLQCQTSHPLLPAVWLLVQSWSLHSKQAFPNVATTNK